MTFLLALRNLLRNRRRSLTTLLAMMLGATAILLFGGYVRDIKLALQSDFVRLSGHLQVQHRDYFRLGTGNPAAFGIRGYEGVIAAIQQDPTLQAMTAVVTPTLQFGAIAGNFASGVSRTAYVTGAVTEDQNRLRDWNDYGLRIISKRVPLSGTAPDSAVIGTGLARVLQLCAELEVADCDAQPTAAGESLQADATGIPDDIAALGAATVPNAKAGSGPPRIEVLATNSRGAPNVAAVRVVRAEFQGIKELDDVHLGLHLPYAQRLVFGAAPPQVTAIVVQLRHTSQIAAARERLDELLAATKTADPLAVLDYETLNPFYGQTLGMFSAIFGFMSILIGAIVLFTVSNTMTMVVVERTVEIGTLRAIGLRRNGIRRLFLAEGFLLGLVGAILGILMAHGLAWIINNLGLTWTPPGRVEPVPLAVQLAGEYALTIGTAIGLVLVAAVSAFIPANRAARLSIVDALRHA